MEHIHPFDVSLKKHIITLDHSLEYGSQGKEDKMYGCHGVLIESTLLIYIHTHTYIVFNFYE